MAKPKEHKIASAAGSAAAVGHATGVMTVTVHNPLPEHDPLYAMVGRVASEWAHFEHVLDLIIWDMAELSHAIGACITAQMLGSTNRLRTIISLAYKRGLSKKAVDTATELMNTSYTPQEDRNRIVHDPWYMEMQSGTGAQFRSMPYKTREYGFFPIDEGKISELVARIQRRRDSARKLRELILGELATSQKR